MVLEQNEEITLRVNALTEFARTLNGGDMLLNGDIERVIGIAWQQPLFRYIVNKFRRRLLRQRGIALRPKYGEGMLLLTPSQQVRVCAEDRRRRMFGQSTRAKKEIEAINNDALSILDRRIRLSQLDRLQAERKAIRGSIREIIKDTTNPIRPIPQAVSL